MTQEQIRNFSIIAHIDHGKSTLADRLLEECGALSKREQKDQFMDSLAIERERGITIKLNTASIEYVHKGEKYLLNLIDTPGHVDFSYEVNRSLAASEGAILIVDAAQGVQAQTIANLFLALENDLKIIPVINKIDLPNADPEKVIEELKRSFGFKEEEIILTSAKTGEGIKELIEAIIERIPAPNGNKDAPLQALIFDSLYDAYRGVIISFRVVNGRIKVGDKIKLMASDKEFEVLEIFLRSPFEEAKDSLEAGQVGFLTAAIKDISSVKVGDTITTVDNTAAKALPGYQAMKPMVFCGLFPIDTSKFEELRESLAKLKLNDSSLIYEAETSSALGFGFRCGFLGLLHMEIIRERLAQEFNMDLITTAPSVIYKVILNNGEELMVDSPNKLPDRSKIKEIQEPYIRSSLLSPSTYIGPIMELCQSKRGIYISMDYIDEERVNIIYELPLSETVFDFFDKLKSYTKGYASFDYELSEYKVSNLVKMDILLNAEKIDALSVIVHKDFAYGRGRAVVESLKEAIPRQMFEIPIQAAIGSQIIARATVKALRKDVLAKCYGGDVSRKRKLLEKQKAGKKKMKQLGSVELPQEAFMSVLTVEEK